MITFTEDEINLTEILKLVFFESWLYWGLTTLQQLRSYHGGW